ncbi:glycosyltransferase family 4 protein [Streptococcus pneumoniae]|nr:glycosyltransferase family 4 protein [Streptococcus pneumoniae]MDS2316115.1 glycosyltransferase family 4 protein [Streptococcus pneumoniae]MDS2333677.1 glycosyltransferase family 4 protein [Streptococcus pneumoniae]MDS2572619.1 glycosyltransferase family 4 protein [Streptococcus pneumoniae]MDS2609726.1 glycosyltransferase family 4 protein [Streptococcus pneumoniae]
MKKIAIVRYNLSKIGGAEKVAINMANEFSQNHKTYLISILLNEDKNINYDISSDVEVESFFYGDLRVRKVIIPAMLKLRKHLIKNEIDLVFSIAPATNIIIFLATLGLNIKTVFCDHHSLEFQDTFSREIQRYIGAKFFDKIVTLTEEDKNRYRKDFSLRNEKVTSIYNWMEDINNIPAYTNKSKSIITVGRIEYQKGYDYLAKAIVNVLSKYKDWEWDIYGSGNEQIKQDLITELDKGGVLSRVHFKGNVNGTENIYPGHSIYVMTSRYEGLPLVLLEAKQYGLPIVSFKCPTGPSEIVLDEENGYLVDNYDVDYMSRKISDLIENENLRLKFSDESMKDTEKFSKKKIIKQWEDLIEEMTGE